MKKPTIGLTALLAGTVLSSAAMAETIRFWTTEDQPERIAVQQELAAQFEAQSGIAVDIIPVPESDMGTRATAAFAAGDLPDVIYHPLPYLLPWAEAGILDPDAATDVIETLSADTFAAGSLELAEIEDGIYAGVPVDGWTQMVVYRTDLFEEAGLEPPTSYANILAAVEALHNPPELYGFVAATKVDEDFMSQVLEHVFLANGVSPVDENGFAGLDEAATIEVLEFYKAIADASPDGDLFWQQSREVYFAGQAAMIIWSPFILDELAGLRDSNPPTINDDPTSPELAENTGFITTISGPSKPNGAAWAQVSFFSITTDADVSAAEDFVTFLMNDGYVANLGMAPEGKFPVRRGTTENPTQFAEQWAALDVGVDRRAPLSDFYPGEVRENIIAGLDTAARWGAEEGQLALASRMINSQIINRRVREFIDGERDAAATVALINEELSAIE